MRYFFFILLSAALLLSACNNNEGAKGEVADEYDTKPIAVKDSVNDPVDRKTGQEISKHLVELSNRIKGVNDANAVVLGPYAVVGIDVNQDLDRSKVESIKYSVAESLRHDPHGANAVVIADADTNKRLQAMGNEIQQGRPIAGILDELAAIVGRVMPEAPSDLIDNQEQQPTEQDNDQLPKGEQQKLDKEQQDQSNNYLKKQK
ncbi:YhcN/YlaJ family sporulation lipoprotein [Metabacillus arenae]|uniref:YhcN/YlaJ family sporulation lipoprotein n=1 Tax=Metabacillus arenae TaxID=2771434 RepID=A0A926RXF1_9BACI|nr:YhcN/YlaJ family sporulation lipoprotein [Metabacillus arenae]MBD1380941.1 YhcN/YlaJ family sporulation lipoprotein [Metabacillus arenae]